MSSANGKDNSGPSRDRYWTKHEKPKRKRHISIPGMQQRLQLGNILTRVSILGKQSDVAVLKAGREEELVRNLAFAIYQQRLGGALDRLRRQNSYMLKIPAKVELDRYNSASKSIDEKGRKTR